MLPVDGPVTCCTGVDGTPVIIDANGDRQGDFYLLDLAANNDTFQVRQVILSSVTLKLRS